ncbi:MAG: type II toxin-antitoxin system HicB family antitoxin [Sphingobacteriales bacterium]
MSNHYVKGYRIILMPEDLGGFSVSVPSLPGCFMQGETLDESLIMADEAIGLYIESFNSEIEIPKSDI